MKAGLIQMTEKAKVVNMTIEFKINEDVLIHKSYPLDDPIWKLPEEKMVRKAIADVRKALEIEADALSKEPVTVRG